MSNWGRWGDADERGALNLVTDDLVLEATRNCRTGKVYALGTPIQREGIPQVEYRGIPQRLTLLNQTDAHRNAVYGAVPGEGQHEDVIVMPSHCSTHMDALCHIY